MSRRDARVGLKDMLKHAREAVELLGDSSRDDLARDRVKQLALTRLVEIGRGGQSSPDANPTAASVDPLCTDHRDAQSSYSRV
jgi:hypothetical protein